MSSRLDLSWDSIPHDGASALVGVFPSPDQAEREALIYAWPRERQENIELGLYLDQVCELLGRIVADGGATPASRRRARHLIRAVMAARRGARDRPE